MQYECAILPFVPCTDLQNFSTLSHKRYDLINKYKYIYIYIERERERASNVFLFFPQLLPKTLLILRLTERDMIK